MLHTLTVIGSWISRHTNKVSELARQIMYALILFGVVHLTPEQQIALVAVGSALLAMFTEGGTVSKQRVGERIDEQVAKRTGANGTGGINGG